MKAPVSVVLLIVVVLSVFIAVTSIQNMNFYKTYYSTGSELVVKRPISVSDPAGNCNCTVMYTSGKEQAEPVPSVSCQCRETPPLEEKIAKEEIKCPDCPLTRVEVIEKEVTCPGVPWFAEGKTWHYPAAFPLCSMDACFNYSKCENSDELLIYSYDRSSPPVRWFSHINESKYHTNDPAKACIFLVFLDDPTPWPPHPNTLPYWNGGLNHVLVIFADKWRQKGPPQDSIGNASVMASDIHETIYRPGFDISIPLPGNHHVRELQSVKALERKYLATFRGLRYLGPTGEGTFRSSDAFRGMHNGVDVIVATSCDHVINNMRRKEEPELGVNCDEDEAVHAKNNFHDLLNTTFGLVPAGVSPSSYRFIEVLSAGAIPVLIADNYVRPFDTLIHWHKCMLWFPTTEVHRIVKTLRALKKEEIMKRQENCLKFYEEFFKDDETLVRSAVRSLKARFVGAIPSFTEVRRKM